MIENIQDARKKITEFCAQELGRDPSAVKFVKLTKQDDGWQSRVEITEQNQYLQKLGYPPIFDRILYSIEIDLEGNVKNFCKQGEEDGI